MDLNKREDRLLFFEAFKMEILEQKKCIMIEGKAHLNHNTRKTHIIDKIEIKN